MKRPFTPACWPGFCSPPSLRETGGIRRNL